MFKITENIISDYSNVLITLNKTKAPLGALRESVVKIQNAPSIFSEENLWVRFADVLRGGASATGGAGASTGTFVAAGAAKTGKWTLLHNAGNLSSILKFIGCGTMAGGVAVLGIIAAFAAVGLFSKLKKMDSDTRALLETAVRDSLSNLLTLIDFIEDKQPEAVRDFDDIASLDSCILSLKQIVDCSLLLTNNYRFSKATGIEIGKIKNVAKNNLVPILHSIKDLLIVDEETIWELEKYKTSQGICPLNYSPMAIGGLGARLSLACDIKEYKTN